MSSLSKKLLGRKILIAMACASLLTGYSATAGAETLEEYITQDSTITNYIVNSDYYVAGAIGTTAGTTCGGKYKNVSILNGASIIGKDSTADGFTVAEGYTLTLSGSSGATISGFNTGIINSGNTFVTDVDVSCGTVNSKGYLTFGGSSVTLSGGKYISNIGESQQAYTDLYATGGTVTVDNSDGSSNVVIDVTSPTGQNAAAVVANGTDGGSPAINIYGNGSSVIKATSDGTAYAIATKGGSTVNVSGVSEIKAVSTTTGKGSIGNSRTAAVYNNGSSVTVNGSTTANTTLTGTIYTAYDKTGITSIIGTKEHPITLNAATEYTITEDGEYAVVLVNKGSTVNLTNVVIDSTRPRGISICGANDKTTTVKIDGENFSISNVGYKAIVSQPCGTLNINVADSVTISDAITGIYLISNSVANIGDTSGKKITITSGDEAIKVRSGSTLTMGNAETEIELKSLSNVLADSHALKVYESGASATVDGKKITFTGLNAIYTDATAGAVSVGSSTNTEFLQLNGAVTALGGSITLNAKSGTDPETSKAYGVSVVGDVKAQDTGIINLTNATITGDVTEAATDATYGTIKLKGTNTVDGAVTLHHQQKVTAAADSYSLTQTGTDATDTITIDGGISVSGEGSSISITGKAPTVSGDTKTYYATVNGNITPKSGGTVNLTNAEVTGYVDFRSTTGITLNAKNSNFSGLGERLYQNCGTITLTDVDFISDGTQSSNCHAITTEYGNINFKGSSVFSGNDSTAANQAFPGVIFIENSGNVVIEGDGEGDTVVFKNNKGVKGGAVRTNAANADGGLFKVSNVDTLTFENNQSIDLIEGKPYAGGGAISSEPGENIKGKKLIDLSAKTITFKNNSATGDNAPGGAINNQNTSMDLIADTILFSGNIDNNTGDETEKGGGAIFQRAAANSTVNIGKTGGTVTFSGNKSNTIGGAIGINATGSGVKSSININGTTEFTGNTSKLSGGAILNRVGDGTTSIITFNDAVTFTGNKAGVDLYGNAVSDSTTQGGAVWNGAGGTITFNKNSVFVNNTDAKRANDVHNNGTLNFSSGSKAFFGGGMTGTGTLDIVSGAEVTFGGTLTMANYGFTDEKYATYDKEYKDVYINHNMINAGTLNINNATADITLTTKDGGTTNVKDSTVNGSLVVSGANSSVTVTGSGSINSTGTALTMSGGSVSITNDSISVKNTSGAAQAIYTDSTGANIDITTGALTVEGSAGAEGIRYTINADKHINLTVTGDTTINAGTGTAHLTYFDDVYDGTGSLKLDLNAVKVSGADGAWGVHASNPITGTVNLAGNMEVTSTKTGSNSGVAFRINNGATFDVTAKDITVSGAGETLGVYATNYDYSEIGKNTVVNLTADKVAVTSNGDGDGAYGLKIKESNFTEINANLKELIVKNTGEAKNAYAVYVKKGGKVNLDANGDALTISATGGADAKAVYIEGEGTVAIGSADKTVDITGDIIAGTSATDKATLNITGKTVTITGGVTTLGDGSTTTMTGDITAHSIVSQRMGVTAVNKDASTGTVNVKATVESGNFQAVKATGTSGIEGGKMYIGGENLNVNITDNGGSYIYGVHTATNTLEFTDAADQAHTVINATNTNISITDAEGKVTDTGTAFTVMSKGILEVDSNLTAKAGLVLATRGEAKTTINASENKTVKLDGDIEFNYDEATSGTKVDASVDLRLTDKDSYFTGKIIKSSSGGSIPEGKADVTGMSLTMKDGAKWNITGDSFVNNLTISDSTIANGTTDNSLSTLTVQGGTATVGRTADVAANVTLASDAKLTLQDSAATTQLNITGDFTATTGSLLSFDAVIGAAEVVPSDSIAVSGTASGTVKIDTANITVSGDTTGLGTKKVIHLFTGSNLSGLIIDTDGKAVATSEGYKYDFVQDTENENWGDLIATKSYAGTLADIVQNKTIADYEMGKIVTYSLVEDYTSNEDLGTLTRVSGASSRELTIYGNGETIDGGSYAGITVNSGDSLTLKNIAMQNFAGDVVNNAGTLNINTAKITGKITNSGTANLSNVNITGSLTNSGTATLENVNTTEGWTLAEGSVTNTNSLTNGTDLTAMTKTGTVNGTVYASSGTLDLRGVDLRLKGAPVLYGGTAANPTTLDTLKATRVFFGDIYDGGGTQVIKNIILENCTTAYRAALGVYYDTLTVDTVKVNAAEGWYWNQQYQDYNYQMYTGFGGTLNINKSLTTGEYMNAGYSVGKTGITNLAAGAVLNCLDFQNTGDVTTETLEKGTVHVNGAEATLNAAAINNHAITTLGTVNLTVHNVHSTPDGGLYSVNYGTNAVLTIGQLNFLGSKEDAGDEGQNIMRFGDNATTTIGGLTSSEIGANFYATGTSVTTINKDGGNAVNYTGDIVFTTYSDSTSDGTQFSLKLDSADDYFTGAIRGTTSESNRWGKWGSPLNGDEVASTTNIKGMTLSITNGAKWNITGDSFVNNLTAADSSIVSTDESLATLTLSGANTNAATDSTVKANIAIASDATLALTDTVVTGKVTNDNVLNLSGGSIDGTVTSSSDTNGKLNIVGDTTLASMVSKQDITVAQGKTLTVNSATEYLDNTDNVTLNGKLNMSDDEATINKVTAKSFTAVDGSSINLDMQLGTTDKSDTVTTTTAATGKIALGSVNVVADGTIAVGTKKIIPIFTNADSNFVMTGTVTATSDGYLYNFVQDSTDKGSVSVTKGYAGTLADIVQDKTISGYEMGNIATYSLVEDYTNAEDLGTLTRVAGASSRDFTINGNGHTIDGGEKAGITVNSGDSLTLTNVTMKNFAGNVVDNAGTLTTDEVTTIYGNVTNSGEATLNGYIAGEVTNSGTMTNTGALVGSIVNSGTLTTVGDGLLGAVENKGQLVLTSGELASDIAGSGTTTIAGSVTSSKSIDNAVAVNEGSSFTNSGAINGGVTNEGQLTLEGKATVSGALTNNGTTNVTGSDVVLNGGTSKFAATGTTNITGKLTATTGVLSFAGTDNFVIASNGTLVTRACNFIDEDNFAIVSAAQTAAQVADSANLDLVFDTHKDYYASELKGVQDAYNSTGVSFLNAKLVVDDDTEQLVIKRDTDEASTSITIGGKPQVVDKDNNVKEVDVTKVPENYVTVVQQEENAGQPVIQAVDTIEVNNTKFTSKGFQVKDTGSGAVAITVTKGANITLVGGSLAEETLVKNEDNSKNLTTDIVVEDAATVNVGMDINTKAQKGTINSVRVIDGEHNLSGNGSDKTDYTYKTLTAEDAAAQINITNAVLTVENFAAGDGTIYVDPAYMAIKSVANNKLGTNIYVSTGSVLNIGGTDKDELKSIADAAGLTTAEVTNGFTVDGMESMLNLAGNYTLASGKRLIVDCAVDSSGNDANNDGIWDADVYFGAQSLLVVDGNATNNGTAALAVSGQSVAVERDAKLYLRNAKAGKTYSIVSGAGDIAVNDAWGNDGAESTKESTTLYASRLLRYVAILDEANGSYSISTSSSLDPSKFASSLAYNSLKEIADKDLVDTESPYGGIKFLSRATDATYIGDAQMIPVQNELTDLAGTVGVQHNALRTSDLTADAIGAHLTQVKCESTDLWAVPLRSNMSYTGRTEAINNVTGLVVGYDKGTKDGRFGVAIQGGWGTSHSEGTVSYSQNKNKFAGVSLYGSRKIGAFDLKASLGYTKYGNDVRTTLPAGLGMGSVQTDIDANTWTADVRLEREIVTKGAAITPHAGLRYTRIHTNSYDNYIVSGDSQTQNLVQIPLGVTFAWNMLKKDGWNLKPYVDLSFVPVLGNKDSDGKVRFMGLTSVNNFATRIVDSTSWAVAAGFTAEKGKFGMGLNYYLQKGSNETNNTVALNLNWKF